MGARVPHDSAAPQKLAHVVFERVLAKIGLVEVFKIAKSQHLYDIPEREVSAVFRKQVFTVSAGVLLLEQFYLLM